MFGAATGDGEPGSRSYPEHDCSLPIKFPQYERREGGAGEEEEEKDASDSTITLSQEVISLQDKSVCSVQETPQEI